ncbi:Meiotic expression up-regulated protein 26 [Cucumispora dikerogammari]|nr:Meiotic expression up-regulated protein 26 [Cucumispora dikerogammari]
MRFCIRKFYVKLNETPIYKSKRIGIVIMQLENDSVISLESLELNSLSDVNEIMEYIVKRIPKNRELYKNREFKNNKENINANKNMNYKVDIFQKQNHVQPRVYEVKNRNLYSPLEIRGSGISREGKCPYCLCYLKMKTSNFWYHMNFTHGVSSKGIKYPTPIILDCEIGKYLKCKECSFKIKYNSSKPSLCYSSYYKHYHTEHRM